MRTLPDIEKELESALQSVASLRKERKDVKLCIRKEERHALREQAWADLAQWVKHFPCDSDFLHGGFSGYNHYKRKRGDKWRALAGGNGCVWPYRANITQFSPHTGLVGKLQVSFGLHSHRDKDTKERTHYLRIVVGYKGIGVLISRKYPWENGDLERKEYNDGALSSQEYRHRLHQRLRPMVQQELWKLIQKRGSNG